MENPNQWEGRENERLSKYDESNEGMMENSEMRDDYSLSDAEDRYRNDLQASAPEQEDDDSRYNNSYGMGSDSSRSLLTRGNAFVYENDHEGQEMDDAWEAARRDERNETYEEERRRLEAERKYGGFDKRV